MHKPETGHLYVLEATGGLVKVGFSIAPRNRRIGHVSDLKKRGLVITREWLSPEHVEAGLNEKALLAFCRHAGGVNCGMGREWFSGVSFDDVVTTAATFDCTPPEAGQVEPRPLHYSLSWRASMAAQVAKAAKAQTMSVAVWIREAIREELERAEKEL